MVTIWNSLSGSANKAEQIVSQLEQLLAQDKLKADQRLPPQRALAEHLSVTVGTVGRAYALAEKRGLIYSKPGSGSYIKGGDNLWHQWGAPATEQSLAMWQNCAISLDRATPLSTVMADYLSNSNKLNHLLEHDSAAGPLPLRQQLSKWLLTQGIDCPPDKILFTYGCQHGIQLCLQALQLQQQTLLCEELCYPGLINQAKQLGVKLRGVAMDQQGITPEGLEQALAKGSARALYLTPTLQNPTSAVMSLERRQQIIQLCQQHGVLIIEDDVSAGLLEKPPVTLFSLAPEQVIYLSSLSKGALRGLRIGYMLVPNALLSEVFSALRASVWNVSPILIDLACQWFESGHAQTMLREQRAKLAQREQLLHHHLQGFDYQYQSGGLHCWLQLPYPWRCQAFIEAAIEAGVELASAEHFSLNQQSQPNAVRISLGQLADNLQVDQALAILAKLLKQTPRSRSELV